MVCGTPVEIQSPILKMNVHTFVLFMVIIPSVTMQENIDSNIVNMTQEKEKNSNNSRSPRKTSPESSVKTDLVAQLQSQGDHYMLKIEEEKQLIDRLERDIEDLDKKEEENVKKILHQRMSAKESPKTSKRKQKAIEDRLVVDIQNLNNLFSTNTLLQEQINDYRQERMKLVSFIKSLDQELSAGKNKLKEYLRKIDVQSKINKTLSNDVKDLKELILKEEKEHRKLTTTMLDTIDRDKIKSRNTKINLERKRKKGMGEEDEELKERELEVRETEKNLKKKKMQSAWKLAKQRAHLKLSNVKLRKYERVFNGILRTKNIHSLNELVEVFISSSKRDIEMVSRLNNLTLQTDNCNKDIQELWQDIDSRRGPIRTAEETVNQRIVRELEEQILRYQDHQNQYRQQFEYSNTIVNDMKRGIYGIASRLGCLSNANENIYAHYGGSKNVTTTDDKAYVDNSKKVNAKQHNRSKDDGIYLSDSDLIKTVALIEQRLNEIIELSLKFTPQDQVRDMNVINRGPNTPARLNQKDLRKSIIEKQHKISELEKKLSDLNNNMVASSAYDAESKGNIMNQHAVKDVEDEEATDDKEEETGNSYITQAPIVHINEINKNRKMIPKRLTRNEIEKSLIEKFST